MTISNAPLGANRGAQRGIFLSLFDVFVGPAGAARGEVARLRPLERTGKKTL